MNDPLRKAAQYAIEQVGVSHARDTVEAATREAMREALTALTLDRFMEKLWWAGISDELAIDLTDSLADMDATERSAYRKRLIGKGLSKEEAATIARITAIDPDEMKARCDVWVSAVWMGLAKTLQLPVIDAFLILETLLTSDGKEGAAIVGSLVNRTWAEAEEAAWRRAARQAPWENRLAMERASRGFMAYFSAPESDEDLIADECLNGGDHGALDALTKALVELKAHQLQGHGPFITQLRGAVTRMAPRYVQPEIAKRIQEQLDAEGPPTPPPAEPPAPNRQRAA